jgi:anti-anti-sigma factor
MRIEYNDGDSEIALIGELTFNDHAAFREMLTRAMRSNDARIVLDLSRLDFVDSAGLGMLLIARDEAGKGSRSLALVRPQKQVERVFAVTRFETLFTIER